MRRIDVIRAWRDPEYRATLSPDQVPSHPAGLIELSDDELARAAGLSGIDTVAITTAPPCSEWTFHNIMRCCPV